MAEEDWEKERKEGKGWVVLVSKGEKGLFVSKGVQNLNFNEIGQLIHHLEIIISELTDVSREILKREGKGGLDLV